MKSVKKITLCRAKWSESKCTCCYFQKNYYVIAVNEKLLEIPMQHKSAVIERKLGDRHSLNKL